MPRTPLVPFVLSVLFVSSAFRPTLAAELSEAEKAVGFVSMFNGRDFTGWRFGEEPPTPETLPANWKVEDGVIKLSGGGKPHLASAKDYGDFEMRFEWRAGSAKGHNSGFFIRSGRNVGSNQINLAKAHEGAFLGKINGAKEVPDLQKPAGEWNEWTVVVVGDKVTFSCNGQPAWEAAGIMPARGYIGLQAEGAPMEFRNLRIREIK
jgi:hypothetical protein